MSVEVETIDCAALTEAQLEDMVAMGGSFDMERLVKAKEDWVLCTTSVEAGKVQGFTFSTLERIGGTPCVLLGLMSVKRSSKRDQILKGLMAEAFHRALMAFPDEDVVVGSRFLNAEGLEAFKQLTELIPRPGHRAVGEERGDDGWRADSALTPIMTRRLSLWPKRVCRDSSITNQPRPTRSSQKSLSCSPGSIQPSAAV